MAHSGRPGAAPRASGARGLVAGLLPRAAPMLAGRGPVVAALAVVVLAVALVALTLVQPGVATYPPTPPVAVERGPGLAAPEIVTVDATHPERWRHFSFRRGAVVEDPGPRDWDLAFRRFHIIANGGPGFSGDGGILDLGPVAFDDVRVVPDTGYAANLRRPDLTNPAIARWYSYGFLSHQLEPKPHVWAVRTADGRHAKIEILSYYCPGVQPGCLTFRYVYQADGSTAVAADPGSPGAPR